MVGWDDAAIMFDCCMMVVVVGSFVALCFGVRAVVGSFVALCFGVRAFSCNGSLGLALGYV